MAAPVRYLSGRQQQQKIGIEGSTQNEKVLEVVGRVGIGTTIFEPSKQLDVRGDVIVSGELTVGDSTFGTDTSTRNLSVSGVSTFTGAIDANGDLDVDGHTELDDVNVSGVSTFTGAADFNGDVDVDGHTELDDVNVSGASTFTGAADFNGDVDIDGHTELDDVNVSGASTFTGAADFDGDIDVDGHTELDDLNVSGVSTFTGAIDANGSLDVDGHTELDDINVSGASTFTGAADFNGDIDVDGHTELDNLNVSGVSTFAGAADFNGDVDVDGHTELDDVNVSGVSTFAGAIDANGNLDVDGHTELDNLNVSGVSTFTGAIDANGDLDVDGHTELDSVNVSAASTFGGLVDINAGGQANTFKVEDLTDNRVVIAGTGGELEDDANLTFNGTQLAVGVNLDVDGHTELDDVNVSGVSTFAGAIDANGSLDVDGHTELDDVNVSGAITATTFSGDLTGNAGTATSLTTARNFEITGDIVASAISFDGTGNVSLAATIQPNSVGLGTDTTGDYVESVSGTANEIVVTGGTGEGSTPTISFTTNPTIGGDVTVGQDLTVTRDLQVTRNLNVDGNVTIGGTSATIFAETLRVTDPDLILGFRTDAGGNDVSNDTTANHGGVAIASTEGSPLITLVNPGAGETLPSTYKKIMWFKTGSFTGLNTDAWISNYAFGVGTTSMSAGTKFAVGNIEANFDDITAVRNINSSGVVTATSFVGSVEVPAGGSVSGTATSAINLIGGDTGDIPYQSATNTTTFLDASSASTGQILLWSGSAPSWGYVSAASGNFSGSTVQDEGSIVGTGGSIAIFNFVGNNIQATATTGGSGIATITVSDTPTFTSLKVTGISTIPSITGPTTFTGGDVNVGTAITMDPSSGIVSATAFYGSGQNLTDLINQRIEGIQVFDEGVQVGSGYTFSSFDFVGPGVTATGIGSTATITITAFPPDADENLFAGTCAGGTYDPSSGTACFNIFLGSCAGKSITEGDNNVFLGSLAGNDNTTGGFNNFFGNQSGRYVDGGSNNNYFGYLAGAGTNGQTNDGDSNNFLGYQAGACNQTGGCNNILGHRAGFSNTTGSNNNFIGSCVGYANTTGSCNTMIGLGAGQCAETTGSHNVLLGSYAGKCASGSGCYNNFFGYAAGHYNTTGSCNTFIGVNAGYSNTTGSCSVMIGRGAGQCADTTGSNNVFLGTYAGKCVSSNAGYNFFVGFCAGAKNTDDYNIFLGHFAGSDNTTGSRNLFVGCSAGSNNTTGENNIILGTLAGIANTTGSCNVMIGRGVGRCAEVTGEHNVFLGTYAGKCASSSGENNVAIGYSAGSHNTTGSSNISMGQCAGMCNTTGSCNVFLGKFAGYCNTTGCYNTFFGQCAGYGGTGGLTGNRNTAIGQDAGKCLTSGSNNVFLGKKSGHANTTGYNNVFIGQDAGCSNTAGDNIFIGDSAGRANGTGACNIFLGRNVGRNNDTGSNNIFFGRCTGYLNTTGSNNVFLGRNAGCSNTTGSCNIALGYDVQLPSATGNTQLAIGLGSTSWIAGDSSFNVTIANKLLVNASGIVTASSGIVTYYGDGSNLTNLPASGVVPTENTTNQAQFIPFFTGTASTSIAGVSTTKFVFNPSTTRLGIGLTDPDATLEINVGTAVTALDIQGSAGQLFSVTNNLTSGSIFSVNDVSGIPSIDVDADGTIQLAPFSTTEFVGVGTTNPTTKLHVVGEVTATDFNSTSDARLKTNVQVIDDPLEKVLQINGVSFNWVENNKPSMGVIADNIEEVLPELVSDTNPKTVNYNGLIGLLIEVVKDQQTQINSLNERLSQLE